MADDTTGTVPDVTASRKGEKGLLRRIAEKVVRLGAYALAGFSSIAGPLVTAGFVEQFNAPVQKTIAAYMQKYEQGTLADDGIEGLVKRHLVEENVPTLASVMQKFNDEIHPGSVILEDRNGVPYAELQHRGGKVLEDGILVKYVPLSAISPYLTTAAVAAEDERFECHYAWDVFSLASAIKKNTINRLLGIKGRYGASTIEIQIVDRAECIPTNESEECTKRPPYSKKFREMLLSALIESISSKKDILEAYLNIMYLGRDKQNRSYLVGVEAAAEHYFGKHAADLGVMESVLLVSMIKNPGDAAKAYQDILKGKVRTRKVNDLMGRTQHVLEKMRKIGNGLEESKSGIPYRAITEKQFAETLRDLRYRKLPFVQPQIPVSNSVAYEYARLIRRRLTQLRLPAIDQHTTIRVRTAVDLGLQEMARDVLIEYVEKIRATGIKSPECLNGSVVVLDTKTNDLLALINGTGIKKKMFTCETGQMEPDYIQRAEKPFSTGSAIKPFVAWMYLENGGSMQDVFYDGPKTFKYPFGKRFKTWPVHNFKNRYNGNVTLEDATVDSLNSVYAEVNARLIQEVGADRIRNALSLTGLDIKDEWRLAMALGAEVSPVAFAGAFSMFANGGRVHWYETGDANVRTVRSVGYENPITGEQRERIIARQTMQAISSPSILQAVDHALRGVVKRGTAKAAEIRGYDIRGKTGTGETTFMFIGYEPALDKLVMVQFVSDNRKKTEVYSSRFTGGDYAAPAARELFDYLIQRETKM